MPKWLRQFFWTSPVIGENSAQTILRVLGNFSRWGILLALMFAFALLAVIADHSVEEREWRQRASRIETAVMLYPGICTEAHPVGIAFVNRNTFAVANITATVAARRPGRTTNLLSGSGRINSDRIYEAGEGFADCYNFSIEGDDELDALDWTVEVRTAARWEPNVAD